MRRLLGEHTVAPVVVLRTLRACCRPALTTQAFALPPPPVPLPLRVEPSVRPKGLVGKEPFHAFFRAYVAAFASTAVTSHAFRVFFTDHFTGAGQGQAIAGVDWEGWLLKEGMPPGGDPK